jgi:hypothetical protein
MASHLGRYADRANVDLCHQQRAAPDLGWALQHPFCALYGSAPPEEVLETDAAEAPSLGGGRARPGGLRPLFRAKGRLRVTVGFAGRNGPSLRDLAEGSARPRVGAATSVLHALWRSISRSRSRHGRCRCALPWGRSGAARRASPLIPGQEGLMERQLGARIGTAKGAGAVTRDSPAHLMEGRAALPIKRRGKS